MSLDLVLWIAAFICFVVAAVAGDRITRVDLVPLGLALGALTFIVG
jgi:hypothetical protein